MAEHFEWVDSDSLVILQQWYGSTWQESLAAVLLERWAEDWGDLPEHVKVVNLQQLIVQLYSEFAIQRADMIHYLSGEKVPPSEVARALDEAIQAGTVTVTTES